MSVVAERADRPRARQALAKRKRRERRRLKRVARRIPFYLLIAAIFVYALFPFYWALRSAFTRGERPLHDARRVHPAEPDDRRTSANVLLERRSSCARS